jgi:broad specificity phosphatase PhoE
LSSSALLLIPLLWLLCTPFDLMPKVFDRVSTFLDSLWRSFDVNDCKNYVLVTHGISIRVILTRYFRYTIDQFHLMANPRNCEIVTLQHDGRGRLVLSGRYELLFDHEKEETDPNRIVRYRHHKKLRCLPARETRKATARIAFGSEQKQQLLIHQTPP